MTPPPYIPMANGLAQSVVSLARFIGPLTGGVGESWLMTVHGNAYQRLTTNASVCSVVEEYRQRP